MIKYHSLSTAIFAPGWTHECSSDQDKFENRDQKFWNLLEPLLYHQGLTMTSVPEQDLNPGSGSGSGSGGGAANIAVECYIARAYATHCSLLAVPTRGWDAYMKCPKESYQDALLTISCPQEIAPFLRY